MSEKYKNTCKYLNYFKHLLILALTVTGCVWISVFALLVCVLVGIKSSTVALKICAITAVIYQEKEKETWWNSVVRKY